MKAFYSTISCIADVVTSVNEYDA